MKLDAGEIEQLVSETEDRRSDWSRLADRMEQDWRLSRYRETREEKQDLDGIDIAVAPDPFNVIQRLQLLVHNEMRVEVPNISTKDDDAGRADTIVSWLLAFDVLSNRQQGSNHINDMTWQSGVLGRGASQILWIGDVIPEGTSTEKILPIWRRTLDPRNVGVSRGPYWTDFAYHKYDTTRAFIQQRYPKFKLPDEPKHQVQGYWNEKYQVIDFWARHQGSIWHSVVIGGGHRNESRKGDFALGPDKTDYPDIPIIEWYGDGAPVADEQGRSVPLLYAIHELWKHKCDQWSSVATALKLYLNPVMVAKGNFTDIEKQQITQVGPGAVAFLKPDQSLDVIRPDPNVPMVQAFLQMIQGGIDQATFASAAYGEAPGGVTAGFALNDMAQQAQARASVIRQNIEAAVESENALALALIENFADDEGVMIHTRKNRGERGKPLKLNKRIIKGNYDNQVRLIPERPTSDMQKLLGGSNLVDKGLISGDFFREEFLDMQTPRDEETRIRVERALKSPQMQLKADMLALMHSKPQEEWDGMFLSTEYWPIYQEYMKWHAQKKAEAEQAKAQRQEARKMAEMQEMMANMPPLPPSMMGDPMQMPPGLGPMSGPESMAGGSMPPGPMPLDMGGVPPGMMGPPMGNMQPQGLPGVPPAMAGQLSPDMLGIPPGAPPGMFDQMMGGPPPSEEDLLNRMLGGGMPPQM
jgi:hypothetical protein